MQARAAEQLLRLITDIKEYMVVNDFDTVNAQLAVSEAQAVRTNAEVAQRLGQQRQVLAGETQHVDCQLQTGTFRL